MNVYRYFLLIFIAIFQICSGREVSSSERILSYVEETLPHFGVLRYSAGFLYVDVDDAYIHTLVSFLKEEAFEEPPYFNGEGLVGAHITVAYPGEIAGEIEECGDVIYFTPIACEIVQIKNGTLLKGVNEVSLLIVEAPELALIREKYGLAKGKHPFHITFGVK